MKEVNSHNNIKEDQNIISNIYYTLSEKEVFTQLKCSDQGLSNDEAEQRLHKYGFNELKVEDKVHPLKIFLEQFYSPLVWILFAALIVSFLLGEKVDALIISVIVIINSVLGFVQEYRAERAIEALKKMASPKARVLRNGREVKIESKFVVPGDILIIETGDKLPADARLFEVYDLQTQEASLTGESHAVKKILKSLKGDTALADRANMVYSSTIIVKGRGKAVVTAIGMSSEVGKIAAQIMEAGGKVTPLQHKLKELGKYLTYLVLFIAAIVFLSGVLSGQPVSLMFLTAVALAVAAIPEGLPTVITITLALGVQRMIKKNALVRKLSSIETLGGVNVICTDKTGTLTHNQMTVTKIWANGQMYEVSGSGYEPEGSFTADQKVVGAKEIGIILKIGLLCNDARLSGAINNREVLGDPTEAALIVSAEKGRLQQLVLQKNEPRVDEIPFSSERKMMTTIHGKGKNQISYTKGAPDIIVKLCDRILVNGKVFRLNRELSKKIIEQNELFAGQALRVLGFAYNDHFSKKENAEKNMIFVGLQAMIDPPRIEVQESIQKCQHAGIRVIMVTGDQLATAKAIANKLGITGDAILGQDIKKINLEKEISHLGVFARVDPAHKTSIIHALKKKGYVVAMTGDGVNDAPALKKADIGVAMGLTGTDVAKEASDMILTDDNFTSIVNAVEEGRGIFDNIRKCVNYLLSCNLGEVMVVFMATIYGAIAGGNLFLPLTAVQLLWVNLITDGLPATALGVDPHSPGIMERPPKPARESILSKELRWKIIIFGLLIGVVSFIIYLLYLKSGQIKAQTMIFTALVTFEVVRLQQIRSEYQLSFFSNKWLVGAVAFSLLLQILVVSVPVFNGWFGTVSLTFFDWLILVSANLSLLFVYKIFLFLFNRRILVRK